MKNTSKPKRAKKSLSLLSLLLFSSIVGGADKTYTEGMNVTTSCNPPTARTTGELLTTEDFNGSKTTLYFSVNPNMTTPFRTLDNLDINCTSSIPASDFGPGIYYKAATFTDSGGRTSSLSEIKSLEITGPAITYEILCSEDTTLDGADSSCTGTQAADLWIYIWPEQNITSVDFYINDVYVSTEQMAPYELAAGQVTNFAAGTHTIRASITLITGVVEDVSTTFTVGTTSPPNPPIIVN